MPSIFLLKNPLDPQERENFTVEPGTPVIDWLQDVAPEGFGMPIRVFINQKEIDLYDLGIELQETDVCYVLVSPADGGLTAMTIFTNYVLPALIGAAVGFVLNLLFPPKKPKSYDRGSNPVYDIGATRNQERLGGAIPVVYGPGPLTVPDYAAAPYNFFSKSGSDDMYLDALFCLGVGDFEDIEAKDILIGETPVTNLGGSVEFCQFRKGPASGSVDSHSAKWGRIKNRTWNRPGFGSDAEFPFMEDVYTHPAVTDWEFNDDLVSTTTGHTGVVDFVDAPTPSGALIPALGQIVISATDGWNIRAGSEITITGTASNNQTFIVRWVEQDTSSGTTENDGEGNPIYDKEILHVDKAVTPEAGVNATLTVSSRSSNAVAGPYIATPVDKKVVSLWFDFVAPQGLYRARSSGRLEYLGDTPMPRLLLQAFEIDDSNVRTGAVVSKVVTMNHNRAEPVRRTFNLTLNNSVSGGTGDIVPGRRYEVQVTAQHPLRDNQKINNTVVWSALRVEIDHSGKTLYDDVTLLAVRMKATNGISGQAQDQLKVRARRKYKCLDGITKVSGNPADIAYDIFTDKYHGLSRPDSEVDLVTFGKLRDLWDMPAVEPPVFNGVFLDKSTCWEGMETALSLAVARPAIDGGALTIIADKKKPLYSFVFNDANIIADSYQAVYTLDMEGESESIELEYRDYNTFNPAYVRFGDEADPNPIKMEYFGLTDKDYALKLAELAWNRRIYQRQSVKFKTEMEGMLPQVGDRILVASPITRSGVSGRVMSVKNPASRSPIFVLDKRLDWTQPFTHIVLTDPQGRPSKPVPITVGASDNEVILAHDPVDEMDNSIDIDMSYTREPPRYTTMSYSGAPKDMTVTKIVHDGGVTFTIDASLYPVTILDTHPLFKGAPKHLTIDSDGTPL